MHQHSDAHHPIPGATAIRFGIALLGVAGFALSYDALRHMAVASHVREPLSYVFPLVIDGFIAIGIGALLTLRTAPLRARLYVWTLVGTATATSITANALHAIRLNDSTTGGLRLDNLTVGALSAIAPLALAGAVHLYLLVRRHSSTADSAARDRYNAAGPQPPADAIPKPAHAWRRTPKAQSPSTASRRVAESPAEPGGKPRGRQPSATLDELVAIGRDAPLGRDGRVSRRSVEKAIRDAGHTIGKDRLVQITKQLQTERDQAQKPARPEMSPAA